MMDFGVMQQKTFPKFEAHAAARCFHCDAAIGQTGRPLFYGFPAGAYGMWCDACKWRTYYDTTDASIKFDKKGDPLEPTCSCGCTTPVANWDTSDGWPRCPDCQFI
jgi:hypothetical protein